MKLHATVLCALAIAIGVAAAPSRDNAVIVNTGSTNTPGYKISVWSDGSASVTMSHRDGSPAGSPKSFSVAPATAARFFSDLAASRAGKAVTAPCMKSASFGTSTHINWNGWVSPDLDCPPNDSLGDALVRDYQEILKASGVGH
jgi:hypothetical protein